MSNCFLARTSVHLNVLSRAPVNAVYVWYIFVLGLWIFLVQCHWLLCISNDIWTHHMALIVRYRYSELILGLGANLESALLLIDGCDRLFIIMHPLCTEVWRLQGKGYFHDVYGINMHPEGIFKHEACRIYQWIFANMEDLTTWRICG